MCVSTKSVSGKTAKILEAAAAAVVAAACASIDIGQCQAIAGVMDKVVSTH